MHSETIKTYVYMCSQLEQYGDRNSAGKGYKASKFVHDISFFHLYPVSRNPEHWIKAPYYTFSPFHGLLMPFPTPFSST
jgi:hypothetical protein